MSQRLRIAGTVIARTAEDLILAIGANQLLGLAGDIFDVPMTSTPIASNTEFIKDFAILTVEACIVGLTGYELKDFFFDTTEQDYTDALLYNFILIYSPRLLWRITRVADYITSLLRTSVSNIGKTQ